MCRPRRRKRHANQFFCPSTLKRKTTRPPYRLSFFLVTTYSFLSFSISILPYNLARKAMFPFMVSWGIFLVGVAAAQDFAVS